MTNADKIAAAREWAGARGKRPYQYAAGLDLGRWTWFCEGQERPEPSDLPLCLHAEIEELASLFDTEEDAYLALWDAIEACREAAGCTCEGEPND